MRARPKGASFMLPVSFTVTRFGVLRCDDVCDNAGEGLRGTPLVLPRGSLARGLADPSLATPTEQSAQCPNRSSTLQSQPPTPTECDFRILAERLLPCVAASGSTDSSRDEHLLHWSTSLHAWHQRGHSAALSRAREASHFPLMPPPYQESSSRCEPRFQRSKRSRPLSTAPPVPSVPSGSIRTAEASFTHLLKPANSPGFANRPIAFASITRR